MNEIFTTAGEVQEFCQQRNWKFCITGMVAGEVRPFTCISNSKTTHFPR